MLSLVTGATGGIGSAFSFALASENNDLVLTGRSLGKLSALKQRILEKYSVNVYIFPCDLTKNSQREKLYKFLDESNLQVDKLFNVAGVDIQKAFIDYTEEKALMQIRVNVEATIMLTKHFLDRKPIGFSVLTVSSMSGVSPMPYFALYSATKAMLTNFFSSLHVELKKKKAFVTTALFGGVYTRPDIIEDIKGQGLWGKLSAKTPEFVVKKSLKALKKNKTIVVVGFFNKLLYFLMKIAPKKIVMAFIAKRWSKQTKDAF